MQGRRREDVVFGSGSLPDDIQPGDYWKYLSKDGSPMSARAYYNHETTIQGNLTDTVWGYSSPDGHGIGTLAVHTVREEDDGTISIRPGDGSTNSVLHIRRHWNEQTQQYDQLVWHGYVERGYWRAV